MEAINSSDKRVIDGHSDVNQLMPFKYHWAWRDFLNAQKNHWTPLDISMGDDIADYPKLKPNEKHIYDNVMASLSTMDIMAMRNIGLAVMEKITAPEIQAYMGRQVDDVQRMFIMCYQAEVVYADYIMQNPILGYSADVHKVQMRYLGNRRLKQLGYKPIDDSPNPVPWLDEQVNINKEKNFFETKVIEYQSGSALDWEL